MFHLETFTHYYVLCSSPKKVRAMMLQNVAKINGIPAIAGC